MIDKQIKDIDKAICNNIAKFKKDERGFMSQNILSHLRNLVEHLALKIYANGNAIDDSYENITRAVKYVKSKSQLKFLKRFHDSLKIVASHYTLDENNSERLMVSFFEYLIKIKNYMKYNYSFDILANIEDFPINKEKCLQEYYDKIAQKIERIRSEYSRNDGSKNQRYYIHKKKPFFANGNIYYEITFTITNDHVSKFDRKIAFTKLDLMDNYAVKLTWVNDNIDILNTELPIIIITDWEVSIRGCELNNVSRLFGKYDKIEASHSEYKNLMRYLTDNDADLLELVTLPDEEYAKLKKYLSNNSRSVYFSKTLDYCRTLILNKQNGQNIMRYMLYRLNNRFVKDQKGEERSAELSGLYLKYRVKSFDLLPYTFSPVMHNPHMRDLYRCLDNEERDCEFLAKRVINNTESNGKLYTHVNELADFKDVDGLIKEYNQKVPDYHRTKKLVRYGNFVFINAYEEQTKEIIEYLKNMTSKGIDNYENSVSNWLNSDYEIDCEEKKEVIKAMYSHSKVAMIYGSAGTGKSKTINHIAHFFHNKNKLLLAKTNPAIDNLKRSVNAANCEFKTIDKFLQKSNRNVNYDMVIIDECSTVSNREMMSVLNKAKFNILLLVGDNYQIESVNFGNWFGIARNFLPQTAVYELTSPYRSNSEKLRQLWKKVRFREPDLTAFISKNGFSYNLDSEIFEHSYDDEIVLCLNYDGLYGINNLNTILQCANKNATFSWGVNTYKIGDPILFNGSQRFTPLLYNNMKGRIENIVKTDDKIIFDITVDTVIDDIKAREKDFKVVTIIDENKSIIQIEVKNNTVSDGDDDDDKLDTVMPFQVAYAVSIHKAQGLEYDNVKLVIVDEVEELITHNIFYTAITRAKKNLKIFWTPETQDHILKQISDIKPNNDAAILAGKFGLQTTS